MKVVIVGGVAGGASAAARLRRLDEKAQIIIFERSGFISYANCGLPYYVGGFIEEEEALRLQTPESFWHRFRIDARVRHEVTAVNRDRRTVTVRGLDTGEEYEESYDKLILSPGATPIRPGLPGIDNERIYTLRTVEDTLRIRREATGRNMKSALVVGGGFIGVEMAENLRDIGLDVSLVEMQNQVLGQLDTDMVSFVHAHMRAKGVKLLLGRSVAGFEPSGYGLNVLFQDGMSVYADMVILAIGVSPDSSLAKAAGLTLGLKNSIAVNDHMQTSDMDIYAVGDAVEITNLAAGQKAVISLAGPANKQGRVAAENIAGFDSVYKGSVASSVLKVFDLTVATTGMNEKAAKSMGISRDKVILSPANHAAYYPGGRIMTMKLLFEKGSERILGAQIVGSDGVDKRIDVLATAMQSGMKVTELKDLDLAYAPPYSSAKDPVNMAGFIAENVLTGKVRQVFYEDLEKLTEDAPVTLLDVRTDGEYSAGHGKGFELHIPVDELRERISEIDRTKPVYVMCQSGLRSYIACRILTGQGYECCNFAGGYRLYSSIEKERNESLCIQ